MTIEPGPVTAEELLQKPDDGFRYELVEGELRKTVPVGSEPGYVAYRVALRILSYFALRPAGRG